jgi:hypothetical protein
LKEQENRTGAWIKKALVVYILLSITDDQSYKGSFFSVDQDPLSSPGGRSYLSRMKN